MRQRNTSGYARTVMPQPGPDVPDAPVPAPFEVESDGVVDWPLPLAGFTPEPVAEAVDVALPAKRRGKTSGEEAGQ